MSSVGCQRARARNMGALACGRSTGGAESWWFRLSATLLRAREFS